MLIKPQELRLNTLEDIMIQDVPLALFKYLWFSQGKIQTTDVYNTEKKEEYFHGAYEYSYGLEKEV